MVKWKVVISTGQPRRYKLVIKWNEVLVKSWAERFKCNEAPDKLEGFTSQRMITKFFGPLIFLSFPFHKHWVLRPPLDSHLKINQLTWNIFSLLKLSPLIISTTQKPCQDSPKFFFYYSKAFVESNQAAFSKGGDMKNLTIFSKATLRATCYSRSIKTLEIFSLIDINE